jgi:hypothetical protein
MSSEPHQDMQAAMLGQRGGYKRAERLTAEERRASAKLAARARWHPDEFQAEREKAQRQAYLIRQALKGDGQLPLV